MFFREKTSGNRTYLQLVENRRDDGKTRQTVLATLGRLDVLQATGAIDALLLSGARFSKKLMVISAHKNGETINVQTQRIGPSLIFERLWKETGCQRVIATLLAERNYEFNVERAIFLTVLHRLITSGSDRSAEKWRADYQIRDVEGLQLHHLYRSMAWLGEELPFDDQCDMTRFAPRCTKDLIEENLFQHRRDLFSSLEFVFFDTTSIYFEGQGGQTVGDYGKSKDHRPDRKQLVVGMVLDQNGRPLCCEMWPGNASDVKSLIPVVDRLRRKFGVGNVCIVSDRGMISKETMAALECKERGWKYILGVRMRNVKEVKEKVLADEKAMAVVNPKGNHANDPSPLQVKEVKINKHRYIVCFNEDQAKKDAFDREAILDALMHQLKRGDKTLIGNKGYRKYLKKSNGEHLFCIDEDKTKEEARYDGKWVLQTNTDLNTAEVALKYKQLWMVEHLFRSMKSILETRPIYHKCDETILGHVFCSFLALTLRKELMDRLECAGLKLEWKDVIRDLDALQMIEVEHGEKRFLLRTEAKGTCGKVFKAVGVAMPPTVHQLN